MKKIVVGIIIGLACLFWFTKDLDWPALGQQLSLLKHQWVILSVCLLLLEFVLRAFRWKILLRPLEKIDNPVRIMDLFIAQVIGGTLNTILPLRLGEIAKPTIAARRTKLPFWSVTATAVMERVYDLFGMVSVLIIMVLFLQPDLEVPAEEQILIQNLQLYGGIFGFIALVAMGLFFTLASQKVDSRHIFEKIVSIAPTPIQRFFLGLFDGFVEGLGNTRDIKGIWQAALLSIIMWLNGALAIFSLFQAFSLPLPFGAACFVSVAIALTVALPQAPGFIGVFHIAIEKTMLLWGQDLIAAQGFALVFWFVSFLPVSMIGIVLFAREDISLSELRKKMSGQTKDSTPQEEE